MDQDFYNSDDALGLSPPPKPLHPKLTPSPSPPPPIHPPQVQANLAAHVSTPSSKGTRYRSNRPKNQTPRGDVVLIRSLDPRYPDIARLAGLQALPSASASEAEESEGEFDMEEGDTPSISDEIRSVKDNLIVTAQDALSVVEDTPARDTSPPAAADDGFRRGSSTPAPSGEADTIRRGADDGKDRSRLVLDGGPRRSNLAVEALVSLKDVSPKTSHGEVPDLTDATVRMQEGLSATSSPLREHAIPRSEGSPDKLLPAIRPPPSPHRATSALSPGADKPSLPPLRSQLNDLADAATKKLTQSSERRGNGSALHVPPVASISALVLSPSTGLIEPGGRDQSRLPRHYSEAQHQQILPSPVSNGLHPVQPPSPARPFNETSPQHDYRSKRELPAIPSPNGHAYYGSRKESLPSEQESPYPSSIANASPYPTTSSDGNISGESFSPALSGASHDRRFDIDGVIAPHDHGQQSATAPTGNFKCTYPGCPAPPFSTQYLLNSHTNVHSQARPYHCDVPDCNRGKGQKGFKRKNEMKRHALVHKSPGYLCPFCADKEHKYPRADNLQRHVRVNHPEIHKDDPRLRDVLSQQGQGGKPGRRRRHGKQ